LSAARNLIVPSNRKLYFIYNNTSGGFAVTVKVSGQTGVSVPNGNKTILVCNGTDVSLATTAAAPGVTSVNVSGGSTGLSFSGGPVTTSGTITMSGTLSTSNGGTGSSSLAGAGIITTGGGQTIGGGLTVTGGLRCSSPAGGASFGQNTPNGNYAAWFQPNTSGGIAGAGFQNYSGYCGAIVVTDTTSTALMAFFYGTAGSAVGVGSIGTNGTGVGYNTASDYRLKENVTPLANAVTRLKQVAPKNFTWKSAPEKGVTEGFIAHELAEVVPDAVHGEKDGIDVDGNPAYQGVDASFLIPMLTAALQEAIARIEALEAKVG